MGAWRRLKTKKSAPVFSYPCEFKFGAVSLSENHSIAVDFHLINGSGEGRFDFDSILVTKLIPAANSPDEDRPILGEFPYHCARIC